MICSTINDGFYNIWMSRDVDSYRSTEPFMLINIESNMDNYVYWHLEIDVSEGYDKGRQFITDL